MSINSAMLAGVSGLIANSSALAAISDNIANVNTTAYKRNQVDFASVVTAQTAGNYSAGGVTGISRQFVTTQGQLQAAASPTDLAISGDGFFVTTTKATGVTNSDARLFTRAGSFTVDANGYLVNDAGLYLQGWPAQANGTFNTNPSDLTQLQSINVKGLGTAVSPTDSVGISANLDQGTPVSTAATAPMTYAATAGNSMADYANDPLTGTKPDFTVDMNVIDTLGATHRVTLAALKTGANTWDAEIYAVPASDLTGTTAPGLIAAGTLKFNTDGSIDPTSSLPTSLALGASTSATAPHWAAGLGVGAQTVSLDLANLTQLNQTSTVNSVSSNGAGVGNVIGVQVGDDGVVSAVFDNSQVRQIAKVALATFPNPDSLTATSGNAYQANLEAGNFVLKQPGIGSGDIKSSSLEASTVDLSSEFTGLISTQKAYSASSKIITTADQMLTDLLNIIR